MATEIELQETWTLESKIGGGGFGSVYRATAGSEVAAIKLVPKTKGAERELLFVDLGDVPNLVPIIDSGETEDAWVIVMPLAEKSLRTELRDAGGRLPVGAVLEVASDVLQALTALHGRVVHRDLKPENVLRLNGRWCLADFGISRYAEASTAPDTQKFAMSPPYSAPERWRNERVTEATDIYSFGVVLHELLTGAYPFPGPSWENFREQHLHDDPPATPDLPNALAGLIRECMYKTPGSRPRAENLLERIQRVEAAERSPGIEGLEAVNRAAIAKQSEQERAVSQAESEAERRASLASDATQALETIGDTLRTSILGAASAARVQGTGPFDWTITLEDAGLSLAGPTRDDAGAIEQFDVVVHTQIALQVPPDPYGFQGRSHSLWFCDAQEEGRYGWFEAAFKVMALMPEQATQEPFALPPGSPEVQQALFSGMGTREVAWPFTLLELGNLDEFVSRWAGWLAEAANGRLRRQSNAAPGARGSWRIR